ncbi:RNase H domain-containing protein [Trichodelitschia bisporula]|uniref:ribonuclease H n=1 Tax=Trichodelitschia bisporula TaxID=703511 RepID=A0A6G1HMJ5_9PEZI|nr:RNase H domain-containing protein [Trichodelitschia bisporula]
MASSRTNYRTDDARSTSTTGSLKRKRGSELKFYAVRAGHAPGIYHTWPDCLAQVKGFKKAVFKSFTSLTEAEAYLASPTATTKSSKSSTSPQKFYAVRSGRVPGVYDDWATALAQITGWTKPKHKSFGTRAEAEAYIRGGVPDDGADGSVSELDAPSSVTCVPSEPAPKRARSHIDDPFGLDLPLGHQPLPFDAEDGFDRRLVLDEATGELRFKTDDEMNAVKVRVTQAQLGEPLHVWTDGACRSNGKKNAIAGVGVFFGVNDPRNVSEPLKGPRQTNQRAELTALKRALDICPLHRPVVIFSDSNYAINCVTTWYENWKRNGWVSSSRKPVENRDLVEEVVAKIEQRKAAGTTTVFEWVKGHSNDPGNVAADMLAVRGAGVV